MERYENLRVLGQGTFGKCYLVNDRISKELCVIKQIDIKGMSETQKNNTRREAYILQALNHPNIIRFLGTFDSKAGYLNIVMSYAEGGDLSKRIKEAKGVYFAENVILGWFTQIALALKHIHERKIIHRDLKCQNIFLTKDNLVKLGDFGIAKSLKQSLEKAKTIVGTPYYMSPQICDNKDYTVKTDIWSLGVVLYEMCSLKPPFESNSLTNLALKICRGQYSPIPNLYSKQLKKLITDLLTIEPNKRPSINHVIKSPIIQSRIEQYVTIAHKQQKSQLNPDQSTIQVNVIQSRKIQKTKPSVSPKAFENAPNLIMLPTSPANNIKQGKIKINEVKKAKITSSRKRQISEPIQSPRQAMKKNIHTTFQIEKKKTHELKGKKIEEYQPPQTKRKQDILLDEMYESYYLKNIPMEVLEEIISSERDLQSKEQQFNNSVSMILKKYERESLQLQFKEETQSETLKTMLQGRLGSHRFYALLELVRRGSGFPTQELTKSLKFEQLDLIPLISLYYGGYVLNMS